ncbi:MAG: hypothetical protein ACRD8O_02110 [Bryobacteraceae bacterium]
MKRLTRRYAIRQLAGMFGASAFLDAQQVDDALLESANVMACKLCHG